MILNPDKEKQNEMLGSPANTMSASGSRPMATAGQPKATQSGSFTNLRSYIDKNRGATNQSLNKAKSDVGELENQYKQNTNTMNENKSRASIDYDTTRDAQDTYKSFADDPYSINQDYSQVVSKLNPNQEYANKFSQAQNANRGLATQQQALSNISTTGGVRSYLNNIRGNRAGSQGGTNLDQFLLQSTPESREALSGIESRAKNVDLSEYDLGVDYNQLGAFDKNIYDAKIQNRLESDLDLGDEANVNRYNTIQNYLGSGKRATTTPTTTTTTPTTTTTNYDSKDPVINTANFANNVGGTKDLIQTGGLGEAPIDQLPTPPPPVNLDTTDPGLLTQNAVGTGVYDASNSIGGSFTELEGLLDNPSTVPQPVTTIQDPVFMGGVTDITRNQPNLLDYLKQQRGY